MMHERAEEIRRRSAKRGHRQVHLAGYDFVVIAPQARVIEIVDRGHEQGCAEAVAMLDEICVRIRQRLASPLNRRRILHITVFDRQVVTSGKR